MNNWQQETYCDNCDTLLVKKDEKKKIDIKKEHWFLVLGSGGELSKSTPTKRLTDIEKHKQFHFCNSKCIMEFLDKHEKTE